MIDHCIKHFGIWTSGQVCVIKHINVVKMDFVASKLKNSLLGGRCPPDPLPGRCPCTPPGVKPQDPHFDSTPPPPCQIPVSAYVRGTSEKILSLCI